MSEPITIIMTDTPFWMFLLGGFIGGLASRVFDRLIGRRKGP